MICSEDVLTVPLYKPGINANKQLASGSLPCWAAFDCYSFVVRLCFCVFTESCEDGRVNAL